MKKIFVLLGFVLLSEAAGGIGSIFTAPSIQSWYIYLQKPDLAPPNYLFGPVWTVLFLLMGIAAYLVFSEGWEKSAVRQAIWVFGFQLGLNVLWSAIFFGAKNPAGALVEIAVLWLAILWTISSFAKVSKPAAWLLVPYILWVSFAAYLNYAIWSLNR